MCISAVWQPGWGCRGWTGQGSIVALPFAGSWYAIALRRGSSGNCIEWLPNIWPAIVLYAAFAHAWTASMVHKLLCTLTLHRPTLHFGPWSFSPHNVCVIHLTLIPTIKPQNPNAYILNQNLKKPPADATVQLHLA